MQIMTVYDNLQKDIDGYIHANIHKKMYTVYSIYQYKNNLLRKYLDFIV